MRRGADSRRPRSHPARNSIRRSRRIRCGFAIRRCTAHGSIRARSTRSESRIPTSRVPTARVVVKDATGRATGLVVGMEEWITSKLPLVTAAEAEARARIFSRELAAAGVTAFTDASPRNDAAQVELFGKLVASRSICQRVGVMIGWRASEHAPGGVGGRRATAASPSRGRSSFRTAAMRPTRSRAKFAMRRRWDSIARFMRPRSRSSTPRSARSKPHLRSSVRIRPSAFHFASSMAA